MQMKCLATSRDTFSDNYAYSNVPFLLVLMESFILIHQFLLYMLNVFPQNCGVDDVKRHLNCIFID